MDPQEVTGPKKFRTRLHCEKCNFSAAKRHDLKLHVRAIHDKARDFPCVLCEYKATQVGSLRRHVEVIHQQIKRFECEVCHHKSSCKGNLKKHIQVVHCDFRNFKCDLCAFATSDKKSFEKHISRHNGVGEYACAQCDYKVGGSWPLTIHVRRDHGSERIVSNAVKCRLCEFATDSEGSLTDHLMSTHVLR